MGLVDSLWEPKRASGQHSGSRHAAFRSRAAVDQLRAEYDHDGVVFLPPDRTAAGRQQTAAQLADLADRGLLEVRARSGRAAHVKLTLHGDDLARRACGMPTRDSSAGFLVRLVEQLQNPDHPRRWKWNDCLSEAAIIYPAGETGTKIKRHHGVCDMLSFLAHWLSYKHVLSHETTTGCAWFELTETGQHYYDALDLSPLERDWVKAWRQNSKGPTQSMA